MSSDFTAIGQLGISCAVGYVAWQQWKTARDKLKFDRYEKRFRIYNETTEFISSVVSGVVGPQQVVKFDIARNEAYFLFAGDTELMRFLDGLRQKAQELASWKEQAKEIHQVGSEPSEQRDALVKWFFDQPDVARARFAAHLSLR